MTQEDYIQKAIALAVENVKSGNGGPFGCVIVRDGKILSTGVNTVTASNDPTAHAEMVAIRAACEALGSHQLAGCDVYASCEPCPMCTGALYWARPAHVYFAATREEAARSGFDDSMMFEEIAAPPSMRRLHFSRVHVDGSVGPFQLWGKSSSKKLY